MGRVIVVLLTVGVTIYALVDCLRSTDVEVRVLPRPAWALIALLVPLLGGIAYLVLGRQRAPVHAGRIVAPDDDPDFLRSLDVPRRPGLRGRRDPDRKDPDRKEPDRNEPDRKDPDRKDGPAPGAGGPPHGERDGDGESPPAGQTPA
jgi:Phospholipase_D-nuclease N-terminal